MARLRQAGSAVSGSTRGRRTQPGGSAAGRRQENDGPGGKYVLLVCGFAARMSSGKEEISVQLVLIRDGGPRNARGVMAFPGVPPENQAVCPHRGIRPPNRPC